MARSYRSTSRVNAMTDTRDQFHERESQVAPPVRSGETAHTPTPWKVFTTPDGLKLVGIGSDDGGGICDAGFGVWSWKDAEGIANAELIVRAVNCHADMLAALKIFLGDDDRFQVAAGGNPLAVDRMLDGIRALVDKAEGRS